MCQDLAWYVYILGSPQNITYVGIAKNPTARLTQHNAGKGARFTRGRGPWTVIHEEGPFTHADALRRERHVKQNRALRRRLAQK
ncbi:MAG: GIY-YIG nuclease family protein [Magnetospirillum sp.]|nr:MAG: GIY-YIG nuclease family protein [Magnetospirillum sp.]